MAERKSSYGYDDLLACARGDLFGPGNAQLPAPPMLMFDRITEISETGGAFDKGFIRAEFDIKPDLWFFECHFPGNPIMPGCLGLDAMWQMTGFYLGWLGWSAVAFGAFAGFLLGGLVGAVLLALRLVSRKSRIPFGPYMLAGAFLAVFAAVPVADWYTTLLFPAS